MPGWRGRESAGIHFGPAERREGDWFGATVNTASRIAALASDGETVISAAAREAAGTITSMGYAPLGERQLRNVRDPIELFRVECEASGAPRPMPAARSAG